MKFLADFFTYLYRHSWRWYYAHLFPVTWSQDKLFKNNGYTLLTIQKTGLGYFRGTHTQHKKIMGF
jgi:hypothetical protein